MNRIETRGLSRSFRNKEAVHELDLSVPEGSIFALLGPNGAGKTTTIKMLMNLLRPSRGEAWVNGISSARLKARHFETIGYVAEDQELPEWMTVGAFFRYLRPFYRRWDDGLLRSLVERLRLPLDQKIRHLSRGMRMKAKLISSLVYHPSLLVLDEPFTGLDPLVRDQLLEGILEKAGEDGWTVLVSSHDLGEVENISSHVGFLADGRMVLADELEAVHRRFRQVEVVMPDGAEAPRDLPDHWLDVRKEGRLLRFVESKLGSRDAQGARHQCLPDGSEISESPMALKSIFLALARQSGISGASGDPS